MLLNQYTSINYVQGCVFKTDYSIHALKRAKLVVYTYYICGSRLKSTNLVAKLLYMPHRETFPSSLNLKLKQLFIDACIFYKKHI